MKKSLLMCFLGSLVGLIAVAQDMNLTLSHPGVVGSERAVLQGTVLYSQINPIPDPADNFSSQDLGDGNTSNSEAADDFEVPSNVTGWSITDVTVLGLYWNGNTGPSGTGGPADAFNVWIFEDIGGEPAATPIHMVSSAVFTHTPLGPTSNIFQIDIELPTAITLPPGLYWLMVQADMDFCADPGCTTINGQFGITEQGQSPGFTNPVGGSYASHWRNPGGTFWSPPVCTTWEERLVCANAMSNPGNLPYAPDLAFALIGDELQCDATSIQLINPDTITVMGTADCSFDVYMDTECGLNIIDPMSSTFVGTVTMSAAGVGSLNATIMNDVCYYVTNQGGTAVLVSTTRTVPTLGQWTLVIFCLALAFMGIWFMRQKSGAH